MTPLVFFLWLLVIAVVCYVAGMVSAGYWKRNDKDKP